VPTIKHMRARVESIRTVELERALPRLGLDERGREGVEALTRAIVNKILHAPLSRLRHEAEREEGMAYLEVTRMLFDLDEESPEAGDVRAPRDRRDERSEDEGEHPRARVDPSGGVDVTAPPDPEDP
jgi:glutamyl-tRNA reductase